MDEQADVPASRDIRSLTVDSARTEIRRSNKSIDVYPVLVYSLSMSSDHQATIDRLAIPVIHVGDTVEVLLSTHRATVLGTGTVQRISYEFSEPLYWIAGFPCARTASVLRQVQRSC